MAYILKKTAWMTDTQVTVETTNMFHDWDAPWTISVFWTIRYHTNWLSEKNEGVTHTNFSIVNSSSYVTEQLMLKTDFWRNRAKYQVICVMVLHKLINIIYIYIIIVKTYAYGGKSIREWQLSWHKCFTLSLEPQHILIKRIHYVHKFKLINFERLDYMYIKLSYSQVNTYWNEWVQLRKSSEYGKPCYCKRSTEICEQPLLVDISGCVRL